MEKSHCREELKLSHWAKAYAMQFIENCFFCCTLNNAYSYQDIYSWNWEGKKGISKVKDQDLHTIGQNWFISTHC